MTSENLILAEISNNTAIETPKFMKENRINKIIWISKG